MYNANFLKDECHPVHRDRHVLVSAWSQMRNLARAQEGNLRAQTMLDPGHAVFLPSES